MKIFIAETEDFIYSELLQGRSDFLTEENSKLFLKKNYTHIRYEGNLYKFNYVNFGDGKLIRLVS